MPTLSMAEQEDAAAPEGGAAVADAAESSDSGFHNRRLHNYPLIKVANLHKA